MGRPGAGIFTRLEMFDMSALRWPRAYQTGQLRLGLAGRVELDRVHRAHPGGPRTRRDRRRGASVTPGLTWGTCYFPTGATKAVGWSPTNWVDNTLG